MPRTRRKLGEILVQWGLLTEQQLERARQLSESSQQRIGQVLVQLGYVTESDVAKALAYQFDLEYIDLDQPNAINKEKLGLLPPDVIRKYLVLPLDKVGGRLKIVIHDPLDLETLDNLRFRMHCEIDTAVGARGKIKEYIDQMLSDTAASIDQAVRALSVDSGGASIDLEVAGPELEVTGKASEVEDAQQAPIIRLVYHIIREAVELRASDIHIEPLADRVRLRYRIDGVCQERDRIPKRTQSAVIARLKIMAGVKVEEKRVPQDGRIKLRIGAEVVDFRFSCCPAYHGESCVLRILRAQSAKIGLANLGLHEDTKEQFDRIIRRPNGIFLVTGPTGSGKTTTLYSALGTLNRPDRKIITAEDPIEYNFKGINQCQVNEQIGLTFARILRAMLRQAPNVILVGEIRDKEVAEVAIQAALTGHLVFSTLHTNDAPSAITRLIDMGVKPFLVASSIQAVLAQRLVRMLCEACKKPDPNPNPRLLRLCGLTERELRSHTIYQAVGCPRCANTGYRGRKGIFEMMVVNSQIRELAFNRAPLNQIRAAAVASGMRTLLGDGRLKILEGLTTPDEVSRVTQVEGLIEEAAGVGEMAQVA
jgi:type IV pilus assembly protein PilB